MFSSGFAKFFFLLVPILIFFAGCGLWPKTNDANSHSATPAVSDDLESAIPFSTREPEQFQAEIVVTTAGAERKTFIARNGANSRQDFNFGTENQLTRLETDKSYLLLSKDKIYTENPAAAQNLPADDWQNFLTTEWLGKKADASFEKMETVENLTKYRVNLSETSEIFVYVDEKNGLPVKQEFFSVEGAQKTLSYAVELRNVKLETDENLFAVPSDFRKVSREEFQKITLN